MVEPIDKGEAGGVSLNKRRDEIRVLFLGDSGVGKTSIIQCIMTDIFPENDVEKVFETTTLADQYLLDKNIKTMIVDSSTSKDHY